MYWEKIKTGIKKKKRTVFAFLCIGLLFLTASFLMYRQEIGNAMVQPRFEMKLTRNPAWQNRLDGIPLSEGSRVEQKISMVSTEMTGIALYMEEGNNKNGEIAVKLKNDKEKVLMDWMLSAEDITGKGFQYFYLPTVQTIPGEIYTIEVTARGGEEISAYLQLVDLKTYKGDNQLLHEVDAEELNASEESYSLSYGILNGDCGSVRYFFALFTGLGILILAVGCVTAIAGQKKEWIFAELAFLIGIIYLLIIPPYAVPDEGTHFVTAYAKSSSLLGEKVTNEEGNVILSPEAASYLIREENPTRSGYANYIRGLSGKRSDIVSGEVTSRTALNVTSLGYIPQILGLFVARLAGFNSDWLFVSGRFAALLWYCFVMFWAVKLIPPFAKNILLVAGLTPVTIQMVVSYNYDSVLIGTAFFLTAYLFYLAYDPEKQKIQWKDYLLIILALIVIVPLKVVYIPIIGIGLLIPKEKFGGTKRKLGTAVMLAGVSGGAFLATRMGALVKMAEAGGTSVGVTTTYSLSYCLMHPVQIAVVYWNTMVQNASIYLETMVADKLGWLEISIPGILVYGFVMLLLLGILQTEKKPVVLSTGHKFWLLVLTGAGIFLTCFALLLDWTAAGSMVISGVQGRYFIPLLPMFLVVFQNRSIVLKKNIDNVILGGITSLQVMTALSVISFVAAR